MNVLLSLTFLHVYFSIVFYVSIFLNHLFWDHNRFLFFRWTTTSRDRKFRRTGKGDPGPYEGVWHPWLCCDLWHHCQGGCQQRWQRCNKRCRLTLGFRKDLLKDRWDWRNDPNKTHYESSKGLEATIFVFLVKVSIPLLFVGPEEVYGTIVKYMYILVILDQTHQRNLRSEKKHTAPPFAGIWTCRQHWSSATGVNLRADHFAISKILQNKIETKVKSIFFSERA